MKRLSKLMAALLLCIFIACNAKNESADTGKDLALLRKANHKEYRNELESADSADGVINNAPPQSPSAKSQTKEDWDKKIVKTGDLAIEVKNYKAFNEMLHACVKQFGAYVAQEEQNQSDYKIENTVTIKVPVDQFENAIAALSPSTEKIAEKKITSEDVTGELVDTKSRVEAKKRIRDRYLDLLKQAKNMEDVLKVQDKINEVQENIEAAAGRIDYLGHASAFSTIHINFYQVLNANLINTPEPSYAHRIKESFTYGLYWFAELFVLLVSLWPLWSVILLVWFLIRKKIAHVKNKKTVS
jgi:Domain of unknown function (DUF4349)